MQHGSTPNSRAHQVWGALTPAERFTGIGCVLAVVSVFLPWKGYASVSVSGLHGWGLLTLLIALCSLLFVVARSPLFRSTIAVRELPVTDATFLLLAGAGEAVTALLFSGHYAGGSLKLGFYLLLMGAALTAFGGPLAQLTLGARPAPGAPAAASPEPAQPPLAAGGPPLLYEE
jgi:hypothetical protein